MPQVAGWQCGVAVKGMGQKDCTILIQGTAVLPLRYLLNPNCLSKYALTVNT
uniref:Uncharacterized protein n=1 Tax=Anguilla anguilla TaxID=7936 RepID=A0A0E9SDY5_ANGAN